MTGYQRMLRAVNNSVFARPNGLWERLVFPLARVAYRQGFEDGYADGFIDADLPARIKGENE